jgi:nucleotide-binding universal stress UspA family protein
MMTESPPPSSIRLQAAPAQDKVLMLLMPIKRAGDVIYGARYARRLREWGIAVKINVLHVTPADAAFAALRPRRHADSEAEELLREATLYLERWRLGCSSFIFSGDVVFSILDAAEMLDCQEIVLPAVAAGRWQRLFCCDVTRRIARASRSATVVLADPDGMHRARTGC